VVSAHSRSTLARVIGYYTEQRGVLILLLVGGDKSTQQRDIRTASALAKALKESN
jgi:putative addiction module killer protein